MTMVRAVGETSETMVRAVGETSDDEDSTHTHIATIRNGMEYIA